MIDVVSASETLDGYQIRAWTGIATDEGVGLLAIVEVSDASGRPLCRFEEFLDASRQRTSVSWSRKDGEAAVQLQEMALERARGAVLTGSLHELHGHRFESHA